MRTPNFKRPVFLPFPGGALCPLLRSDLPLLTSGANDAEMRPYLYRHLPEMEKNEEEWFDNLSKQRAQQVVLGVVVLHQRKPLLIGVMDLHNINLKNGTATTGSMFWDQRFWNKGIGTKAKMVLLKYAFHTLGLRQVYSEAIDFNRRSTRYSEKCGYQQYGTRPEHHLVDGRYHDVLLLRVTRSAWEPLWEAFRQTHGIESLEETLARHQRINRKS